MHPHDTTGWKDFPLAAPVQDALERLGATWNPHAPAVTEFPEPFDRVAGSLTWPKGWSYDQNPVQFQGWNPEAPEFPLLMEDDRRWVMIGEVGEGGRLLFLALEGDDPPVVVLDNDFSGEVHFPEPLSAWLEELEEDEDA